MPVAIEVASDSVTPVALFLKLVEKSDGFLLESVEHGGRWSRYSFVGLNFKAWLTLDEGEVSWQVLAPGDALEQVKIDRSNGYLGALEDLLGAVVAPKLDTFPPLHSGVVGYIGYDIVREIEYLPNVPKDDVGTPDAMMGVIGQMAAFDHWRQRLVLIDNVFVENNLDDDSRKSLYLDAINRLNALVEKIEEASSSDTTLPLKEFNGASFKRSMEQKDYMGAVKAIKEFIVLGDAFQVVLSQRFDLVLESDPFDVYRVLRQVNPSPYLYFLRNSKVTVVGASPEPMVKVIDGRVISRPIAGTRKRGATDEEDRILGAELIEDPKEKAEHVMLVDLARNDVGRVVNFGSEEVDELMVLEHYSHVMHLTSQVSGELKENTSLVDVLRATLPAGTLSGAPKVRAMEIIDELEVTKRGIYGGVVGYFDFSGNMDTAIAIRTMVVTPNGNAFLQAGAGIVADSDPEKEDAECLAKAAAMISAISGARSMASRRIKSDKEKS